MEFGDFGDLYRHNVSRQFAVYTDIDTMPIDEKYDKFPLLSVTTPIVRVRPYLLKNRLNPIVSN